MQSMAFISWIAIIKCQHKLQLRSANINCNYVFIFSSIYCNKHDCNMKRSITFVPKLLHDDTVFHIAIT